MANPEHLKILKQGVEAWNKWREENPKIIPDLCGVCLSEMNLKGINLHEADLFGTKFHMVNLSKANLSEADFGNADLSNTDLSKANLYGAVFWTGCLREANLTEANLTEARLYGSSLYAANLSKANLTKADLQLTQSNRADFHGAILVGANLRRARLSGTNFSEANLSKANLKRAIIKKANLSKANLSNAEFTPAGEPDSAESFLDLSTCEGLETAKFSSPDFLQNYLLTAFEYIHNTNALEAELFPDFFKFATEKIKILLSLYDDNHPPKQLIYVIDVITAELLKYMKKHPKAMYQIKPRQFEELVAEILASYGWQVSLTPTVKDGGYDIFAISKDVQTGAKASWIIECKKYAPENKVGVDIVRSLFGVKYLVGTTNAMLATTSFFTKGAKDIKASRYDVELKDYTAILEWINQYRPNPNGKLYIKDNRLILPDND